MAQTRRTFIRTTTALGAAAALPAGAAASEEDFPSLEKLREAHQQKGIIAPNKTYRMMEWECHTPPEGNFEVDFEGAVKAARDAGAESMMFYSQDHWGHAFYLSDHATRHPQLKFDVFGREVELARKHGMSVVCYYSLQFNNQIVLKHPDWGWIDEHGDPRQIRWYVASLYSPYREYVLRMMEEIFSRYEVDELFLDIFGPQFYEFHKKGLDPFGYSKYDQEAWNRDHPGDPYREGFKNREGWERRYRWHQKRTMTDMLDEIIAIVRKHRPNTILSLNGGPESFPNDIMQKVSFIYAEPITTHTGISIGSMLMRGWGRPDYQAGVFSRQGYLDTFPGSIPRVKADALMLQNARTFIVGNAPIVGNLDGQGFSKRWFKVASETWEDLRGVDAALEDVQPLYSAAALYSEATLLERATEKRPTAFRASVVGALETLTYSGRPVEAIPEFRLTDDVLKDFELFVLPEVDALSSRSADVIRRWVTNGGTLIATGKCGLLDENRKPRSNFPLADVFGVDYEAEEKKYAYDPEGNFNEGVVQTYLESTRHRLTKELATSTVGLPGTFLKLKKRPGAEEIFRYRLPLMVEDLNNNKWFNWGPPPPGTETGGTAGVYHKFGKGQVVYLGVPLFESLHSVASEVVFDRRDRFWIRKWIPRLVRQLAPDPIAEIRSKLLPEFVHGTFFYDKSRRYVLVQILNAIELATEAQFTPVSAEIFLNPEKLNVKAARTVWPQERDLEVVSKDDGKLHIQVPMASHYTALYLKLA